MEMEVKEEKKRNADLIEQLVTQNSIHLPLPKNGELKIDKLLPFLIVYRIPPNGVDEFTYQLGKSESSYIYGFDEQNQLTELSIDVARALTKKFKGFLILEIWLTTRNQLPFTIYVSQKGAKATTIKLKEELDKTDFNFEGEKAEIKTKKSFQSPDYYPPILGVEEANKTGITYIGLEIHQFYLDSNTGNPYPVLLRNLRTQFSIALRKTFYEFIRTETSFNATNFQMLGTTSLDKAVFEIDDKLAHFSNLFDFLLLVTPVNVSEAWEEFKEAKFKKDPTFHYRSLPIDPELVKRELFNLPIEKVEDPTVAFLLRDKRKEIDHMLDMMSEREKPGFSLSSIQVFGNVEEDLLDTAKALLVALESGKKATDSEKWTAQEFAKMAEQELTWLQKQCEHISTVVRVRDDVEGIMVSRGTLNINENFMISKERAFSLLQHEVGTHIVTYYNGKAQPLKLFYVGVPGYEELQEGLAVLAEYLTGGLTTGRMRTIAARVVAVHSMLKGRTFTETFSLLNNHYQFTERAAFFITTRVYRGGGLTKDAVYLKGLLNIIKYIKEGNDLSDLLIGKIRQDYLPFVQELIYRGVLNKSPIKPRYLENQFLSKLDKIKDEGNIFNLLKF